jgi:hypothetical protein
MLAPGTVTEPVMFATLVPVPPGHSSPDCVTLKPVVAGVNVADALFHVLPGRATAEAVIVQISVLPTDTVITALPFVTSTAVVLVAVNTQALADVTVALDPEMFVVQSENVGPASAPAALTVVAMSLPVERTPEW